MAEIHTARLFKHDGGQAVHLPQEFHMAGTEVRVRRIGRAVLLEPVEQKCADVAAIFSEIDRLGGADFLPEGRPEQPAMPTRRAPFDE